MTHQILVVRGAYSKARIETSPSKELLVVFFGLDFSAAVKIGFQDGAESWRVDKIGRLEKNHPIADGRAKKALSKILSQEEDNLQVLKRKLFRI